MTPGRPEMAYGSAESTAWEQVLDVLRNKLSIHSFETWMAPLAFHSIDGDILHLTAPTQFFVDWIDQHYHHTILQAFVSTTGTAAKDLVFHVEGGSVSPAAVEAPLMGVPSTKLPPSVGSSSELDPRYAFDTFVVGSSNQLAHAACQAVAAAPGRQYNPLFIYGGVGLGKTHLMQAIGHAVRQASPTARIVYVSSERYMNELIQAIQRGDTLTFKDKYRGVDLLLIDDIQFLETKERTQEEFFHTFNALYEARRQIVVTSDRPPQDITLLEERLMSRFQCGLVADIQAPDVETRVAILHSKAESEGQRLADDVALHIANIARSNIRELEGAFTRLIAMARLQGVPLHAVSVPLADRAIISVVRQRPTRVEVEDIQHLACRHFGVTIEQMRGKRRTAQIVEARQVAMALCRELTNLSLADIGARFGKRDHTTVLYACDKIRTLETQNAPLKRFLEAARQQLQGARPN